MLSRAMGRDAQEVDKRLEELATMEVAQPRADGDTPQSFAHFVAQLPTPRLRGHITAMAERPAQKALESTRPLEDGARSPP